MADEVYVPWQPLAGIPRNLCLESLTDTDDGLVLLLSAQESRLPVLRVRFDAFVAYRNVNESYRLRLWHRDAHVGAGLLIVQDSKWTSWLEEESRGALDARAVVHYAILTAEDCVDVVARAAPSVEWTSPSNQRVS